METIKAVIAEDTLKDIKILQLILEEHCDNVEVVGVGRTVEEASTIIKKTQPDVLFLDVEMPPESGFDVLNEFPEVHFDVIFTTAHEEYAIQAIKFAALDYILKPLHIEEVKAALQKVKPHRNPDQTNELIPFLKDYLQNKESGMSKIVIPEDEGYSLVKLEDIIYCEASDSYTKIHLVKKKTCLVSKPLKEYDSMLGDKGFYRTHKSFIVNMNHISRILKGVGAAVIMSNNEIIPIALRKKNHFFKILNGVIDI